jgi:hypothetical protein
MSSVLTVFVFSSDIVGLGLASNLRIFRVHLPSHVVGGYYSPRIVGHNLGPDKRTLIVSHDSGHVIRLTLGAGMYRHMGSE